MKTQIGINSTNGYVFNIESKQLEKYEFINVRFTFSDCDTIVHECLLGGISKTLYGDFNVYANNLDFEQEKVLPKENVDICNYRLRNTLPLVDKNGKYYTFAFVDGQAKEIPAQNIEICYNRNQFAVYDGTEYYQSAKDVYIHNDYIIKENDGTERIIKSAKTLTALTPEQMDAVEMLSNAFAVARNCGLFIAYDRYDCIKVYNRNNIEDIRSDYDIYENEGEVDIYQFGMNVPNSGISFINDDDKVCATFKKS